MAWEKVDSALAALFPRRCILCDQPSGKLNCCAGCLHDLPWIKSPCSRCGDVLPAGYTGTVCGSCHTDQSPADQIISALVYEYPVDRLIAMAKFSGRVDSANALGEMLAYHLRGDPTAAGIVMPELILPVPLHARRMAERGFNQATEIARPLTRALRIPLDTTTCRRIRNTAEQTRMNAAARATNTRRAFRVTQDLAGKKIAVVDDVITTGSTARSLARTLREAGARHIQIWTVARAVRMRIGGRHSMTRGP